ncbi:MAG: nuclear transport factor 2 family protein [Ignavibacteriae bacterium]|nr:nuclear transport factor 2 family protein [Ignavibacteriota bacterium]
MERKEWLEKLGGVIDARDSELFASYFTEDGIFRFGNAEPVKGRRAVADYVAAFFNMIKGSEHKVVNHWEQGGNIIWQGEVEYTRLDGKKVKVQFTNIFYMKGELIDQYLIYIDNTPLFAS